MNAGGPTDDEHEEACGDGVESTAVSDLSLLEAATYKIDDIVGGSSGGFIDQEKAVELWNHEDLGWNQSEVVRMGRRLGNSKAYGLERA